MRLSLGGRLDGRLSRLAAWYAKRLKPDDLSMRAKLHHLLAGCLIASCASVSLAADLGAARPPAPLPYAPPVQPYSFVSEIRIGGAVHDPGSPEGKLGNWSKVDVNGEILFARPVVGLDPFWQAFVPRPTVGGSYSTGGRTSYAYLGATWTVDLFPQMLNRTVFLEGFFGGAAHDGYTGPKEGAPFGFNRLGCNPLFREAAALGFRITEHWSVMATVEHMSNAGLCGDNRGLTNFGGKVGYTF